MVYTITCDYITRAAFNNLSHKFLLLGTVIFAGLADVFRVSLNYEGLVAVTYFIMLMLILLHSAWS
jgi:predicted amino acid racemase